MSQQHGFTNADHAQVRATNIVVEHFHRGQFPPNPFPLSLGVEAQEPSSEEMRQILDWEHLIRCIEDICLHNTEWGRDCYYNIKKANSETPPSEWSIWKQNFRRSMYQSLMMGAVLCSAYQEALAPPNKDELPEAFLENCDMRLDHPDEPLMKSEEMAYLLKYPVFNFEAYDDHSPIYGRLADFVRQQTEHHPQFEPGESKILGMYPEDATPDQIDWDHAKVLHAVMVQCLLSSMTLLNHQGGFRIFEKEHGSAGEFSRGVTIVPLGSFYPLYWHESCKIG